MDGIGPVWKPDRLIRTPKMARGSSFHNETRDPA